MKRPASSQHRYRHWHWGLLLLLLLGQGRCRRVGDDGAVKEEEVSDLGDVQQKLGHRCILQIHKPNH